MKKQLLFTLLTMTLLTACGGTTSSVASSAPASSPSSTTTSEVSSSTSDSPYSDFDLSFRGITIDNVYEDYSSASFGGMLEDIGIGAWMVVGDEYTINVDIKDLSDQTISVEFDDPSICEYRLDEIDGQKSQKLIPLKTGGTTMRIYDANHDLIYRNAINCRVAIRDIDTMFEVLYQADYWAGAFSSAAGIGYYRFSMSADENHNIVTISGQDSGISYAPAQFEVDLDNYVESDVETFHTFDFSCTMITTDTSLNITHFAVSLSLDTIYVSEDIGILDFFRPVYLD